MGAVSAKKRDIGPSLRAINKVGAFQLYAAQFTLHSTAELALPRTVFRHDSLPQRVKIKVYW